MYNCIQFLVINVPISLCRVQGLGKESDGVELAFLTLLLKDGADSVSGGVAIDYKWVLETGLSKDGGHTDGIDERLKRGLMFIFPKKLATLSAKCDEHVEGSGQ